MSRKLMYSCIWMFIQVLLVILQVLLQVAKGLCVEKLKGSLVEQLEKAVDWSQTSYMSCHTWTSCESTGGRATTACASTTGGGGATISSICGGAAASSAVRGAACVYSYYVYESYYDDNII